MYEKTELKVDNVTIEGYEIKVFPDGNKQYNLKTNKGKFKFSEKTKEGKMTKAMENFNAMGNPNGQTVGVNYSESEKEYNGIKYKDKRIMFFSQAQEEAVDTIHIEPLNTYQNAPLSVHTTDTVQRLDKMAKWATDIEKRLQGIETLLVDLRGDKAVDLHQSFPPVDTREPAKKFQFDLEKAKSILQAPQEEEIPVINIEVPEGFTK